MNPSPSKSHVWRPNMTNDTSLESSTFAIIEFFIATSSYIVKMFAKKNLSKKWKIIHFWKALDHAISNMQIFCKILNNLIFNQEKLKCSNFLWQDACNNFAIFFAKLVQFVSLCQRLSKKLNFIKIWQVKVGKNKDLVCYRKKQSFRQCAWGLRQLVLKPSFRPKGRGLGM